VRRAAECIAAAATALPRLDALVFTAGIGENAGSIRARIVARLGSIGVAAIVDSAVSEDAVLPPAGTASGGPTASPSVLRIAAREDLVVAREAARLVRIGANR
jgi:acetate kinase